VAPSAAGLLHLVHTMISVASVARMLVMLRLGGMVCGRVRLRMLRRIINGIDLILLLNLERLLELLLLLLGGLFFYARDMATQFTFYIVVNSIIALTISPLALLRALTAAALLQLAC